MLLKKRIIIPLLLLVVVDNSLCLNNTEIKELRETFFRLEDQLWNYFTKKIPTGNAHISEPHKYLYTKMHNFSTEVEKVQPKLINNDGFIILPSFRKIANFIENIDETFQVLNTIKDSKRTKRAVDNILDKQRHIRSVIEKLNKTVSQTYFETIKEETKKFHCVLNQSQKQTLYNLYKTIAISELKAYSIMQFTDIHSKLSLTDSTTIQKLISTDYKTDSENLDKSLSSVLKSSNSELWKCDPRRHKKDETYIEITELLQGYFINKNDLNPEDHCYQDCGVYTNTSSQKCSQNSFCKNQKPCKGTILNCKKFDPKMEVCLGKNSRLEYVEFKKEKRQFGKNKGCEGGLRIAESWATFDWSKFSINSCDYCFCLCDQESFSSDRYINLRPTFSNIKTNRVVTGVRFKKYNRIIYLQIQEGKLLPYGKIDMDTVRWVPVEKYNLLDVLEKVDYHKFTNEEREINLDTIKLNQNYVVTGVDFKVPEHRLTFRIHATPFDFKSGQLLLNEFDKWVSNYLPRDPILLINPDNPLRILKQSKPYKDNSYVGLRATDTDADAAQTTVPFFDAQPVAPSVPAPLSGMGIYLKGGAHSGGFIAPKIITYDYYYH